MPHCASYPRRISKSKSAADSCVAILTILNWSAVADLSRATIRLTIRAPFPCESASAEAALSDSASVQGLPPRFTQAERPLQVSKSFDWIGHVGTVFTPKFRTVEGLRKTAIRSTLGADSEFSSAEFGLGGDCSAIRAQSRSQRDECRVGARESVINA